MNVITDRAHYSAPTLRHMGRVVARTLGSLQLNSVEANSGTKNETSPVSSGTLGEGASSGAKNNN